jgi:putative ATP-dependent endonuclease of OLD family
MFLERLTLINFQCFGPEPTTIRFDTQLTAMLGGNAAGKTAACQALSRLFSVVGDQRQIRVEDFHVPDDEEEAPATRARASKQSSRSPSSRTTALTPHAVCRSSSRR